MRKAAATFLIHEKEERFFLFSNTARTWPTHCSAEASGRIPMTSSDRKKEKQRQCLMSGVAVFLATYLLNLCTLNPHLHAAMIRQVRQSQQVWAGHCARPFVTPPTPDSHPANHEQRTEPLCCELRGAQSKALRVAPPRSDASPLPLIMFLPPVAEVPTRGVSFLPLIQVEHSSHPLPLYLLHAALLI